MGKHIKIYCVNTAAYIEIEGGETLSEILARLPELPFKPICARVNNRTEALAFQVFKIGRAHV